MTSDRVQSRAVEVRFDKGRHFRAKIGFVVLAMEQTVEDDAFTLTPDGVGIHFSRIAMSNDATVETLAAMAPGITESARLLLPEAELDVLSYTCNSGTMVIGEAGVMRALREAKPEAKATTVMTSVARGLRALGARRIVVATPYLDEVNDYVLRFLRGHGFEVLDLQGLNIKENTAIDLVEPAFLRDFAGALDRPDADAVFVCCGALRALDIAAALEGDVGKPVVVSNQAMMWGLPASRRDRGQDSGLWQPFRARLRRPRPGGGGRSREPERGLTKRQGDEAMTRSVMMSELCWSEYKRRLEEEDAIVLLPVGAVEQHGHHLPLGTDWMMATEMSRRAAERVGGIVAPPVSYAYKSQVRTGGGNHYCGTTSLDGNSLINMVRDVLKEFARHGARKVAVIDGHYENEFFLTEACDLALRDLRYDASTTSGLSRCATARTSRRRPSGRSTPTAIRGSTWSTARCWRPR